MSETSRPDRARGARHDQRRAVHDERQPRTAARGEGGRALPLHQLGRDDPGHRELGPRPLLPRHAPPQPARDRHRGRPPVVLTSSADRGHSETVELTNLELKAADGKLVPQATVHVRVHTAARRQALPGAAGAQPPRRGRGPDRRPAARRRLRRPVRGARRPPPPPRTAAPAARRRRQHHVRLRRAWTASCVPRSSPSATRRPPSGKAGRATACAWRPVSACCCATRSPSTPIRPPSCWAISTRRSGALRRDYERWENDETDIYTDNEQVNVVLRRAQHDLRMLSVPTPDGRILHAGLPWFSAPFGRDMLMASLETLLLDLRYARASVSWLARRAGPDRQRLSARSSPARSCTSCAAASWPACAASRTRRTSARSTDAALAAHALRAHDVDRRPRRLRGAARRHRRCAALARRVRRHGRRRLRRVRAPLPRRAPQPGLARRRQRRRPHGRQPCEGTDRARRGAGLRLLRAAPPRRRLRPARRRRARPAAGPPRRATSSAVSTSVLDGGRGLLRAGARRREAAGQDGLLDHRALPVVAHHRRRVRTPRRRAPHGARLLQRAGASAR